MIYLDNAATTMQKPEAVAEAVVAAMGSMGNSGRGAGSAALQASRIIYDARVHLTRLFGGTMQYIKSKFSFSAIFLH